MQPSLNRKHETNGGGVLARGCFRRTSGDCGRRMPEAHWAVWLVNIVIRRDMVPVSRKMRCRRFMTS